MRIPNNNNNNNSNSNNNGNNDHNKKKISQSTGKPKKPAEINNVAGFSRPFQNGWNTPNESILRRFFSLCVFFLPLRWRRRQQRIKSGRGGGFFSFSSVSYRVIDFYWCFSLSLSLFLFISVKKNHGNLRSVDGFCFCSRRNQFVLYRRFLFFCSKAKTVWTDLVFPMKRRNSGNQRLETKRRLLGCCFFYRILWDGDEIKVEPTRDDRVLFLIVDFIDRFASLSPSF